MLHLAPVCKLVRSQAESKKREGTYRNRINVKERKRRASDASERPPNHEEKTLAGGLSGAPGLIAKLSTAIVNRM
jgi:hypothetical protein